MFLTNAQTSAQCPVPSAQCPVPMIDGKITMLSPNYSRTHMMDHGSGQSHLLQRPGSIERSG
ncbi:hypothetical protein Ga0074115_12536 [endosymbiont of Ridgeia piscesae]|jgi:hypothetical protein|uniref:Uncharacterized protein n=1 Tax=endosymbiont of Ridgeia piscesae TaxID=54398 RepID=A0A0T5Z2R1_9GAMM|nr:hypothetical protein Ga0074115_12536 [endosymbiont of Ridgeia piscesae]KRT57104.1 hypothetical protein Ga0076813_108520 [endosymbiont of Ridgeia piscesae]